MGTRTFPPDSSPSAIFSPHRKALHEAALQESVFLRGKRKITSEFGQNFFLCTRVSGFTVTGFTYYSVGVSVAAIMTERNIPHSEPMIHPKHTCTVSNLMQTFDTN